MLSAVGGLIVIRRALVFLYIYIFLYRPLSPMAPHEASPPTPDSEHLLELLADHSTGMGVGHNF